MLECARGGARSCGDSGGGAGVPAAEAAPPRRPAPARPEDGLFALGPGGGRSCACQSAVSHAQRTLMG